MPVRLSSSSTSSTSTKPKNLPRQAPCDSDRPPPPQQPGEQERQGQPQGQPAAADGPTQPEPSAPTATCTRAPQQPGSFNPVVQEAGGKQQLLASGLQGPTSPGEGQQRVTDAATDKDGSSAVGLPDGLLSRSELFGLVVNMHQQPDFAPWRWLTALAGADSRHWLGLRCFGGVW